MSDGNFKIVVTKNIGEDSLKCFGEVGNVVKVVNGKIYDEDDGCYFWKDWQRSKGKTQIEKINNFFSDGSFRTEFEIYKKRNQQPGTKTWLMELIKENTIYAERKDGRMFLVLPVGFAMYDYAVINDGYDEKLKRTPNFDGNGDIVRVYKSKWLALQNLTNKDDLELLWQREEDIDPIEIKEWLEEFTGMELKTDTSNRITINGSIVYNVVSKRLWVDDFRKLGFYKGIEFDIYEEFNTHKEALQWLKDNLVKHMTKEEKLDELINKWEDRPHETSTIRDIFRCFVKDLKELKETE